MIRTPASALVFTGIFLLGCGAPHPTTKAADSARPAEESNPAVTLLAAADLPYDDTRTRELSGIAWDAERGILFAVSDTVPIVVPLTPSADFKTWTIGEPFTVDVPDGWDGEGLALTTNGFYVANEKGPFIYRIDRGGRLSSKVELPAHFATAVRNKSLESLSLSPDGRYLFTANESTLSIDGPQPTPATGATVRIYRREIATGTAMEFAYRTDPVCAVGPLGDMGVSDLVALSATEVLVMERSFVPSYGNSVRLYRVQLDSPDVLNVGALSLDTIVAKKKLFLDLSTLPAAAIAGHGGRLLANYEGLSLGPRLLDGRRVLFVISDDNANPELVARILVLAITGIP